MNTHTTTTKPQVDLAKLSARDRKNYENGCREVERKLARARLAKIALKSMPTSYRIVPPTSKKFEAAPPVKRVTTGPRRHVTFNSLLAP